MPTNDVQITDYDTENGFISSFQSAVKCCSYFYHIAFLETCKHADVHPNGLVIDKKPFISFVSEELSATWYDTLKSTENYLHETLLVGLAEKLFCFEEEFWKRTNDHEKTVSDDEYSEWLVKLIVHINKQERILIAKKRKKLRKLITNQDKLEDALSRFEEHINCFEFRKELEHYAELLYPDIPNIVLLILMGGDSQNTSQELSISKPRIEDETENDVKSDYNADKIEHNVFEKCELENGRYRGKFVHPNVINLSGKILTKAEISLLSKGLKFVPTPNNLNRAVLKEELESFGRRLRLMWHYRNEEGGGEINIFRKKSTFNPKGKDAAIEMYLSRLEEEILALDTKLTYSNITREEKQALNDLRNDTSIIIKGADKGSAVVVWDRDDYLKEAEKQLSDKDVYEEVTGDYISPLINKIKYHITNVRLRGDVNSETLEYFMVNNPRIGRFYLLPKIHKRLFDVPGRPVISNCSFYTENISAFVDHYLQPLARKVKSYIKDTNDFLLKLKNLSDLPDDFLLCTIDVVGLYPNIPHEDGLTALRRKLDARENKDISTDSLMELAECVLKNNVFEHNKRVFRQKQGTAIGTKMAPSYAILFMSDFEEAFLKSSPYKPYVWWRYIDDIFMIWQHGEEQLQQFLDLLNSCHPTLKFTSEHSRDRVNFLDVQVIRENNQLVTDLYVKDTDTHQYLLASSCHPSHCKRSIPFSQCLRLNRICSEVSFFDKRCNDLEHWLKLRGYSDKLVRKQILEARKFGREDLLTNQRKQRIPPKLILNITYHPSLVKLKDILQNIQILLTPNEEHRNVFSDTPVVGFKRGRSLQDILVRAKLPEEKQESGSAKCKTLGKKGRTCDVCPFVKSTNTFTNRTGEQEFSIECNSILRCGSSNVVYLIQCKTCNIQYIGSASTPFRSRFNNYKSMARKHNAGKNVTQASFHAHFAQPDHHGMSDWQVILIDQAVDRESVRRKESFWQYKLNTFNPEGLNERDVTFDYG